MPQSTQSEEYPSKNREFALFGYKIYKIIQMGINFCKAYRFHLLMDLLNDAFFPSLEESWSFLGLDRLKGFFNDFYLKSPISFYVTSEDNEVGESNRMHQEKLEVDYKYDISFPFSSISIGDLRGQNIDWKNEDLFRAIIVIPFFSLKGVPEWKEYSGDLIELFGVTHVNALFPDLELLTKPFKEWTPENWRNDCWTATWDIEKNIVLWAHGAHTPEEMKAGVGKEFEAFAKSERLREAAA